MMYIQDFPRRQETHTSAANANDFAAQLERVLLSLSIPPTHAGMQALHTYDFKHARAHIIASWPVSPVERGWPAMETAGVSRLGLIARKLCPNMQACMHMEAQGSSLAAYDRRWLEHFYLLACGYPTSMLPLTSRRSDQASPEFAHATGIHGWPLVQILFPTQHYVEHISVEGRTGGGCFFGKPNEFHQRQLRPLYAQPVSARGHILMHAKSILVTDCTEAGYVYFGSHNFTRAAWGTVSGTHDHPTQSLSNWELGVVLPLTEADAWDAVPYKRPVTPYGREDAPWDASSL